MMENHAATTGGEPSGGRSTLGAAVGVLALAAVQVLVAVLVKNVLLLSLLLLATSISSGIVIIVCIMGMGAEKRSFALGIVSVLIVFLCLFAVFIPDSVRVDRTSGSASAAGGK